MKRSIRIAFLFSCLGAFAFAQSTPPRGATVEGRVASARDGDYLYRARVTVEGTNLETFTDSSGQYRLTDVPAGQVRITVFYTGLAAQTESLSVTPGTVVEHDFNLAAAQPEKDNVVKLSQFVVSSSREMEGAAIAINEQRFAPNTVNVVSADEFGTVLENNVGDFLKRLPGITIDFIGGAARSVSIGGVPPDYVPIRVGGFDVASVSGGGTGRAVDFHDISMNNIARLEVEHSPTPESPGSALAGSVNLIPRSAFDRARPLFSYDVFMMMRDNDRHLFSKTPGPRWVKTRKVIPGFDFSYIKPVNQRFGFTLTGSNTKQYTEEERMQNTWRGASGPTTGTAAGTQYPDTTPDRPYLTDYVVEDGGKTTMRTSLAATADYKFSPNDRASLSFEYSNYDSPLNQRTMTFTVGRVSPGNFTLTSTHGDAGRGQVTNASQSRHHARNKIMPTLVFRHDGPIWQAEGGLGYSRELLSFRSIDKGYFNNITSTLTGVTVAFDDIFYLRPGTISVTNGTTGAPVDPYTLSNYSITTANGTSSATADVRRSAYGNLRRDVEVAGVPVTLKGGLDVRDALRDNRAITPSYTFVGPNKNAAVLLDQVFSQRTAPYGFPKIQYMSTQQGYNYYLANPTYFTVDPNTYYRSGVTGSNVAEELVSSGFLRADVALFKRRLKLVGGVRAEQTNIFAEGPLTDPTRDYQRNASGAIALDATGKPVLIVPTNAGLAYSQLTFLDRGSRVRKEYLDLFPSLNASYTIRDNLIARAAYYTSIGRPNYSQYSGAITLPDPESAPSSTNVIRVNNTGIKPWTAQSFSARLEYYFEGVGQFSIGGFQRNFKNFFGSTTFPATPEFLSLYDLDPSVYGAFNVATQHNVDGIVRMTGATVDYKQALTFLPHWARGIQVFANATTLRATGDQTANFSGFVPRSFNWGVSLNRPKFNVRVNWNYRGRNRQGIFTGAGIAPGTYTWGSKLLVLDVQAEYYLTKRVGLFANLRNLDDAPNDSKIANPLTPLVAQFRTRTYYGSLWSFGIKGSF